MAAEGPVEGSGLAKATGTVADSGATSGSAAPTSDLELVSRSPWVLQTAMNNGAKADGVVRRLVLGLERASRHVSRVKPELRSMRRLNLY